MFQNELWKKRSDRSERDIVYILSHLKSMTTAGSVSPNTDILFIEKDNLLLFIAVLGLACLVPYIVYIIMYCVWLSVTASCNFVKYEGGVVCKRTEV